MQQSAVCETKNIKYINTNLNRHVDAWRYKRWRDAYRVAAGCKVCRRGQCDQHVAVRPSECRVGTKTCTRAIVWYAVNTHSAIHTAHMIGPVCGVRAVTRSCSCMSNMITPVKRYPPISQFAPEKPAGQLQLYDPSYGLESLQAPLLRQPR